MKITLKAQLVGLIVGVILALPSAAFDLGQKTKIHGFGGWSYGKTDRHTYATGTEDGNYDNAEFSLNITAAAAEKLTIVAQIHFDTDALETSELDYAFAEWAFNDLARMRVGRVKHPFGLYGEIPDVGTLRPFLFLPRSFYGPIGFTAKYYDGLGLTGRWFSEGGWQLQYDVYAGQIEGDVTQTNLQFEPVAATFTIADTLGVKLHVTTPITGLSFGFSAYQGDETVRQRTVSVVDRETYLASLEYLSAKWLIRAEAGHFDSGDRYSRDAAYLEIAYKITPKWQLAARYDWAEDDSRISDQLPPAFLKLFEHEDIGIGLSYWFNSSFVVRGSYHNVQGLNLAFASPEDLQNAFFTGELEDETDLITVGGQFSF